MEPDSLADRIRRLRLRRGLSQGALAGAVGRDRTWVAHLERGALCPAREQVRALAWTLGLPPRRLVHGLEWKPAEPIRGPVERVAVRFARRAPRFPPPGRLAPPASPRLEALLDRARAPRLWAALVSMELPDEGAWLVALALVRRGGAPAWMAPARIGFPVPLVDPQGLSLAHARRPCLLWDGPEGALVLFGPLPGPEGRRLPPVLAVSGCRGNRFLALEERAGQPGLEPVGRLPGEAEEAEALFRRLLQGR